MPSPKVKDPVTRDWSKPTPKLSNMPPNIWWHRRRFRFLNRMAPYTYDIGEYAPHASLEHFIQVSRASEEDRPRVAQMQRTRVIRNYYRSGELTEREDWHEVRDQLVWDALCRHYSLKSHYPEARVLLMATFPEYTFIGDANTGCENHWGVCICPNCLGKKGRNTYGHFLLKVRELLLGGVLK